MSWRTLPRLLRRAKTMAYDPHMDEEQTVDQEWLKTDEGRWWLQSDDGLQWLATTEGRWWSQGEDAMRWYEEQAREGWAAYFKGETWPTPPSLITPDNAPKVGSRVRIKERTGPTFRGETFERGELCVVAALQFNPIGSVTVELRTADGRKCICMHPDDFEAASEPAE
jgi:hypothetical protein